MWGPEVEAANEAKTRSSTRAAMAGAAAKPGGEGLG